MRSGFFLALLPIAIACASAPERCVMHGGDWRTPVHARHTSDGVCIAPAADEGKACGSSSECNANLCLCPGAPAFESDTHAEPRDGAAATGHCARYPARGGAGWICTVEHGAVQRQGMIVD